MSKDLIFFSYASPNRDRVKPIYDQITEAGFNTWIDYDKIMPGQKWDVFLKRALLSAELMIIFITKESVDRRGYVQREVKHAVDMLNEKLDDDIYILPILLDPDVPVPDSLNSIQYLDFQAEPNPIEKLKDSIRLQLNIRDESKITIEDISGIHCKFDTVTLDYDGIPGLSFFGQIPVIECDNEDLSLISDHTRGWLIENLLENKYHIFGSHTSDNAHQQFHFGQKKEFRTNTFDANCDSPLVCGRYLSLIYKLNWYGAGAAHPNMGVHSFNYIRDPLMVAPGLPEIFDHSDEALTILQDEVQRYRLLERGDLDEEWVAEGTREWRNLHTHSFDSKGLNLYFAPYEIGCYASGDHVISVGFKYIDKFVIPYFKHLLDYNVHDL